MKTLLLTAVTLFNISGAWATEFPEVMYFDVHSLHIKSAKGTLVDDAPRNPYEAQYVFHYNHTKEATIKVRLHPLTPTEIFFSDGEITCRGFMNRFKYPQGTYGDSMECDNQWGYAFYLNTNPIKF